MSERLFKVLNTDGSCWNGGHGQWSLPTEDGPGEWMPAIEGELVACENGYHLCRENDLVGWLGPAIFEAEYRGERVDADDKIIVREARLLRRLNWDERSARLFACDCAERVLPLFEAKCPNDERPRRAIETARRYAVGEATLEELDAVWDTAWDTTWYAARDADWDIAWNIAWYAARATAWAAAWYAGGAAARPAEREWQMARLLWYLDGEQADRSGGATQ